MIRPVSLGWRLIHAVAYLLQQHLESDQIVEPSRSGLPANGRAEEQQTAAASVHLLL
jgi:hypothetical protein